MLRRDLLRGTAAAIVAGTVSAQEEAGGPFGPPTAKFRAGGQHELPPSAFGRHVPIPLVPRPTAIGSYEQLVDGELKGKVFGIGDSTPIGECFHGIAREWGETPGHWAAYGCDPAKTGAEAWNDKAAHFGSVASHDAGAAPIPNWGGGPCGLPIKCFKIPIVAHLDKLREETAFKARMYSYANMCPGPTLKMRLGQPVVVRFENHMEAETSVHLHGGHSPSHSDGFPSFYVLQGKARDYFYPNILPLYKDENGAYQVDVGESQSTMWYHDHAMDATAYNVSKGMAGFAPCFGEEELKLIRNRVLPGLGEHSCFDPELKSLRKTKDNPDPDCLEDQENPGFYRHEIGKEPYFNPYDIPLVLQDKVIDLRTGQIAYDNTGHNGYIGDSFFVNGVAWPKLEVRNRKYRFRILDGSNARVFRLRLLAADDFWKAQRDGIDAAEGGAEATETIQERPRRYDAVAKPFLRIGKDSWLWSHALERKDIVLAMANRADIVVDFGKLAEGLAPDETREFFLVNTMPQFDGRGPKQKLDDGGDPRVLPAPFDLVGLDLQFADGRQIPDRRIAELNRPIALMKIIVRHAPPGSQPDDPADDREASIERGTELIQSHRKIEDKEVAVVREFIFERGKGAWQINGRFYDPNIANATPTLDRAEEWVLRNGGGGWWHPIHIHLESHQLVQYEKDFDADLVIDPIEPPAPSRLANLQDVTRAIDPIELRGLHDTQVLGPNTVVRIRMRHRTWCGPFVFHCHNLEHEDMRMMYNFEPVPRQDATEEAQVKAANVVPDARTHGNDVTLGRGIGELPWEYPAVPQSPVRTSGEEQIPRRPKAR